MQSLTDREFARFRQFLSERTGIALGESKQSLVAGRLEKRVRELSLRSFSEYLRRLGDPAHSGEAQIAVDLLTTNETYFFREPKHFELLRRHALAAATVHREFRVLSAACSSGEEAWSVAMVLADCLDPRNLPWSVHGTDISTRVLERARRGHYPLARTDHLPQEFLRRYCLRGVGRQAGTLLIDRHLREHVSFQHVNLNQRLPSMSPFDVIFLRNVMIYFNAETKRQVVERLLSLLRDDGLLFVGHSESLNGITDRVRALNPATYTHA